MGCAGSKNESTLGRLSSYQIAAAEAELEGLIMNPLPLKEEEAAEAAKGSILPIHFHNIFNSGLYAPYMRNPLFLLVIDARATEEEYNSQYVATAKWHGHLRCIAQSEKYKTELKDLDKHMNIIIYDNDGSGINNDESHEAQIWRKVCEVNPRTLWLEGGLQALAKSCPHLIITPPGGAANQIPRPHLAYTWFPSIVVEGQLYLGRTEQAADPLVISGLHLTHIVWVADRTLLPPAPHATLNYLVVPIPAEEVKEFESFREESRRAKSQPVECQRSIDNTPANEINSENGEMPDQKAMDEQQGPEETDRQLVDFASQLPIVAAFVQDALRPEQAKKGRVLICGELGFNRSAALAMAFLMQDRYCTLEDSYYYVKRCRWASNIDKYLLNSLSNLEETIFGRTVTNVCDLY